MVPVQERTPPVDWEDLRFFVALARAGSLSAAARTLRVSHATVGRRVAALEAALGQLLFDRRAGGFDSRSLSLAKREADLAIRVARPQAGELFTRRLATMAYGVYGAPRGDPSAWVGYDDALAHLPEAQWLTRHSRGERVVLRTNSVVAQLAAVRAGYGKALLPCWLAAEERGIVAMTQPAALPEREIWLVVHRDLKDVPRVRAVMDAIVTMFDGERARFAPPVS